MLRHLLKRLTHEKVIEYLSETYIIRRAAQMTVSTFYRFSGNKNVYQSLQPEKIQSVLKSFRRYFKQEIEDVQKKHKK